MNEMLDRLQEGSERQRRFVADASHELRSPLSTIKAAAEVAQLSNDEQRFGELAGDVEAEADRMEAIIADLLQLARLDEQDADRSGDPVDVGAVARHAVDRLPLTELTVSTADAAPLIVPGDESQIERAVLNLLLNGVQYADSEVQLQIRMVGGRGQVLVDDDGSGVAREDRERIFERFVRADQSRDRRTGGAGLGLPIVVAIAARHGGSVAVTDSPGLGGARFILDLGPAIPQAQTTRTDRSI